MTATEIATSKTVDEDSILALSEDARLEVIDGEFVEMSLVGGIHHLIAGKIFFLLYQHVTAHKLGLVFMDGLIYLMLRKGKKLRGALVPDVSFVSKAAIPKEWERSKPFPGAPTLAVEVVSPDESAEKINTKVLLCLEAGTQEVWVVYPASSTISRHYLDEQGRAARSYGVGETLDADPTLPGLRLPLAECFAMPDLGE